MELSGPALRGLTDPELAGLLSMGYPSSPMAPILALAGLDSPLGSIENPSSPILELALVGLD